MGVKVLKQKPSQADAILPCVSLSFHGQASGSYCAVQVQQTCSILGLCFFFSLSREKKKRRRRRGKEVEEAEGEEGSQMSIYRNVSAGGDRCEVIVIIRLSSYSKESLIDL